MNINLGSKKYKIIKELGRGAFGKVYQILNEEENKYYALKKIQLIESIEGELDLDLYKNEAKLLSSIKNGHIVKYYDSFKDNEFFYILMEYCEGLDLKQFIKEHKSKNQLIDEKTIYNIIFDICLGIKEIHQKNLIHRDIKPENIFIDKYKMIKIGDFGISKLLDNNDEFANSTVGTNKYMAPEVLKDEKYNNKVDIWGLGCIIYELLTLNVCFEGKGLYGHVDKIVNKPHGKIDPKKYSYKWQIIIDLLLKKDYKERPDINEVYTLIVDLGKEPTINEQDCNNKEILGYVVTSNNFNLNDKGIKIIKERESKNIMEKNLISLKLKSKIKYIILYFNLSSISYWRY